MTLLTDNRTDWNFDENFLKIVTKAAEESLKYENFDPNCEISLGDIIISVEKAKAQAEEYGHSLEREIAFLTAHSMLHLMGYDHMTEEDEKEMFGRQRAIMENIGIGR